MQAVFSSLMAAWIFVLAVSGRCCRPPSFCAVGESSEVVSLAAECCQHCCQQGHREDEPTAPCKDLEGVPRDLHLRPRAENFIRSKGGAHAV